MNTIKKIKNRSIIELRRFFSKCIRKNFVSEFPDLISFQTNSFCNSKCIGCPHPLVKKRIPQGKMSEVLFYKIIDECAQHNIKVVLPFFMNEPFTDRSILDKVNVIKDKIPEAIVKLNSNGALLTKEICDSLVESKINQLTLGIQGVEKVDFERFMVGLNYDITMENVKYLASLKRHFIIDVNILPFNSIRNKIDQTVQFWDDLGFIPSLTEPWDSAGLMDTSEIKPIPYKKCVKGCYNIDSPFFSQQPLHIINILFNGDVVGCCMDWNKQNIVGNVQKYSIKEIWNSSRFNEFRDRVYGLKKSSENFICKRCTLAI